MIMITLQYAIQLQTSEKQRTEADEHRGAELHGPHTLSCYGLLSSSIVLGTGIGVRHFRTPREKAAIDGQLNEIL